MKKLIVFAFTLILSAAAASALDWKTLHGRSDNCTVEEAIDRVNKSEKSLDELYVLGLIYLRTYQKEKAQAVFDKMLVVDPKNIEGRWGFAEVLRMRHKYDESLIILEKIVKEDPQFGPAFCSLGYIKYLKLDFNEAVRLTGIVINMKDKADTTTLVRAHGIYAAAKGMLAQRGNPFKKMANGYAVLRHLNMAKKLDPDNPAVYFGFGSYYMSIPKLLGFDLNKAEEYLKKAIKADPLFADAYVRLAQLYRFKGDTAKYDQHIKKAEALDPQNDLILDIKAGSCKFICIEEVGK